MRSLVSSALALVILLHIIAFFPSQTHAWPKAQLNFTGFHLQPLAPPLTLRSLVDVAFLPNGNLLLAEKRGTIRLLIKQRDGSFQLWNQLVLDIRGKVDNIGDRGLNAIAVNPKTYAADPWLYIYYVRVNGAPGARSTTMRVSKLPMVGNVADTSREIPILGSSPLLECPCAERGGRCDGPAGAPIDCMPVDSVTHSACQLIFLPDNTETLRVTSGDGADYVKVDQLALRSQRIDSYSGKILSVTKDGKGLPSNPFYDGNPDSVRSKVWAYGLRNPFRSALVYNGLGMFVCQVGWVAWEAMFYLRAGQNGGWPCWEGSHVQELYAQFPECQALYNRGTNVDGANTFPAYEYSHNDKQACIICGAWSYGKAYGPATRGLFFIADYIDGLLKVFRPQGSLITAAPQIIGTLSSPVGIYQSPIDDMLYITTIWEGQLYRMEVGDVSLRTPGPTPTLSSSLPAFMTINPPNDGSFYSIGDTVFFSCSGLYANFQPVPASLITVNVLIHHCYPDQFHCHLHSLLALEQGITGGSFVMPDHDDNAFMEINCQAGNPGDVRGTTSVYVYCRTTSIELNVCLPNMTIGWSEFKLPAPYFYTNAQINGERTLVTPPQGVDGITNHRYRFVAWNDCNTNAQRDYTVPNTRTNVEAIYV